jgi:hypothetical protein
MPYTRQGTDHPFWMKECRADGGMLNWHRAKNTISVTNRLLCLLNSPITMSKFSERLYFFLATIGLLLTWYFNLRFFADGGSMAPDSFFPSAFANPLTTAITLDVYWSALVFSIWAISEKSDPFAPRPWLYIGLCFAVGLAFALPLYLGRRQQLRRNAREAASGNFPRI